jgi:RHS repeat-associated protein
LKADFGFAGMFLVDEVDLNLTYFRAYDSESGRWLSRDSLEEAETRQAPNLYMYVGNNPVNNTDPLGLECDCGDPHKKRNCGDEFEDCALWPGLICFAVGLRYPPAGVGCALVVGVVCGLRYLKCDQCNREHGFS